MKLLGIRNGGLVVGILAIGTLLTTGCQESTGKLPKASIAPAAAPDDDDAPPAVTGRVTIPPHISSNHLPVTPSATGHAEAPFGSQSPTGGLDSNGQGEPPRDSFLPPAGSVEPPVFAPLEAELKTAPKDPFLR